LPILYNMRVLAAVDKFRGTATAAQVASAIGHACWELGVDCVEAPIADGGEGTLDALGGPNRTTRVTDPLGRPVEAQWRLVGDTAVIEMARASGLSLVGGAKKNDVIAASTIGTGQLIDTALNDGAKRIIVCVGGSATVDGGLGAIRAIGTPARLRGTEFIVACDVRALFSDAARLFGAQKGATPVQIEFLSRRLEQLQQSYLRDYNIDISLLIGGGAAGGLAGGLSALGANLVPGFDVVADEVGLHEQIAQCDLIITGEGYLDSESFDGKVVGGVQQLAQQFNKPVVVICGGGDIDAQQRIDSFSLIENFGDAEAFSKPLMCVEKAAAAIVARFI
jgi:glycerate 2-kinase